MAFLGEQLLGTVGILGATVSDEITIASTINGPFLARIRTIDPDRRAPVPGMASDMYALRPYWYFSMHNTS